jgi:hypothetical protein
MHQHDRGAGYTHASKNEGTAPFRVVIIEFADLQGKMKRVGTTTRYCNSRIQVCGPTSSFVFGSRTLISQATNFQSERQDQGFPALGSDQAPDGRYAVGAVRGKN